MRELRGKRVVVMGMERSGLAVVEFLLTREASVLAVDAKPLAELPQAAQFLERWGVEFARQSSAVFEHAGLVVLSPGVPADLPEIEAARRDGVEVIGEVELAGAFLRGRIAGITGSNGKTTTTALVGHMLRESGVACQIGGNIGTAVTAMI
ncbi:MAG: hypothetical protein L0219_09295, partial [Phycisphaerales bacterium]|nr:hypothetical protein [Phycisphaerales bacterium]